MSQVFVDVTDAEGRALGKRRFLNGTGSQFHGGDVALHIDPAPMKVMISGATAANTTLLPAKPGIAYLVCGWVLSAHIAAANDASRVIMRMYQDGVVQEFARCQGLPSVANSPQNGMFGIALLADPNTLINVLRDGTSITAMYSAVYYREIVVNTEV